MTSIAPGTMKRRVRRKRNCRHCGHKLYRGFGPKCPHCAGDPTIVHGEHCVCEREKKERDRKDKELRKELGLDKEDNKKKEETEKERPGVQETDEEIP